MDYPPDNAFSQSFLQFLNEVDESPSHGDPDLAGPWKVEAVHGGFGLFEHWQDPLLDAPAATVANRGLALVLAAALAAAGQEPRHRLGKARREDGFPILAEGQTEGVIAYFNERVMDMLHMAELCSRSPAALAALLEAAGATVLRKTGAILLRNLHPGPR